jgi:hypothetical protein
MEYLTRVVFEDLPALEGWQDIAIRLAHTEINDWEPYIVARLGDLEYLLAGAQQPEIRALFLALPPNTAGLDGLRSRARLFAALLQPHPSLIDTAEGMVNHLVNEEVRWYWSNCGPGDWLADTVLFVNDDVTAVSHTFVAKSPEGYLPLHFWFLFEEP